MQPAEDQSFPQPQQLATPVVLYVTEYCGFCRMAEALLERRKIEFTLVDVTDNPAARKWLVRVTGQRTVPQIFLQGRSIGGYQELASMDRRGELLSALGEDRNR